MNPNNINAILELVNAGIKVGGELLPIALRAFAALKSESSMSDADLIDAARRLNNEDAAKLDALLAEQ